MIQVYKKISLFLIFLIIYSVTSFGQTLCTSTTCITVNASTDDAEEWESGNVYLESRDLELVYDDAYPNDTSVRGNQTVGIRFNSVDVPQGATITNAYIQFAADPIVTATEISHGGNNLSPCNLTIFGQAIDNATTFTSIDYDISVRLKTNANVAWSPPLWPDNLAQTSDQQTVDISAIIQEIVDRSGYSINNSMAIIITGTGRRTAAAYDGTSTQAPQLCIEYEYLADDCDVLPEEPNEGCDSNTDISGTTGFISLSDVNDGSYPLVDTVVTYDFEEVGGENLEAIDLNGSGEQGPVFKFVEGIPGSSGSINATFSSPISGAKFKLTDFDFNEIATVNAYDENNILIDLTLSPHVTVGSQISQIGNVFTEINSGNGVNGDLIASDPLGSIIFDFYGVSISRIDITVDHPSASSIRYTQIEYCGPDYVYDNGWQGGLDPNGDVTFVKDILIRSGDATISSNTTSNTVVVNPEGNLTINSGINLNANSIILESKSDKYSSVLSNGTIIGDVHYDRYVNEIGTTNSNNNGNDLISSPLMGEIFNDAFVTKNPALAVHPSNIGEFAFAPFNTSSGAYENFDIDSDYSGSFNIESGTGYRAATIDGSPLRFSGTVNTGTVTTPIANGEWNLIGNPYPSYLKVNDGIDGFLNNATNISLLDETNVGIYGYDGTTAGGIWTIYNLSNTNSSTVIAPGQGFYVNTSGAGSNIEFTSDMRTIGSDDDFITGRNSNTMKVLSKLQASSGLEIYSTDIYFIEGRTKGLDPGYDAGAFQGNSGGIFTNLVEENSGVEMAIQALPYEDFNDVVVPLGIKANSGTPLAIGIDEASNLPSTVNVYLEDNIANTFTLLNSNDYIFTPSEDINGIGRFFLHYSSSTLSLENEAISGLQIFATSTPRNLFVNGKLEDTTVLDLYDLQGRLVLNMNLDLNSISNKINVDSLSAGIYIVKLKIGRSTKTQKVIIR